jgi:glyoxylase I family protein
MEENNLMIKGQLHHISITCINLEQSKSFYTNIGFTPKCEYESEDVKILMLEGVGLYLELFEYKKFESPKTSVTLETPGYTHMALSVEDVLGARVLFNKKGYSTTDIKKARTGIFSYFFVKDPDGNLIEVLENYNEAI